MELVCKQKIEERPAEDPESASKTEKNICCAFCMHPVTKPENQTTMNGAFRHVFANPHGYVYEIGCFSYAPGCRPSSTSSSEFSWFSGYSWQIGVCELCASHLGWRFSSEANVFYGLILDKLIFP